MSPHVTREQLDRLRDARLPPAEIAQVGRHAATCLSCGAAVGEMLSIAQMTRDLRIQIEAGSEPEHLSDEELMAFADGTLGDQDHLRECDTCRSDLDELIQLKRVVRPRYHWVPYAIAASIGAIALVLSLLNHRSDIPTPAPAPRGAAISNPVVTQPNSNPLATGYAKKQWSQWVAEVKRSRELPMPSVVAELRRPKSHLRGEAEEGDLQLRPDSAIVASSRPKLQWLKREAAIYNVILQTDDRIAESGPLTHAEWTPPIDLKRGREYAWQVEMTIGAVRSIYPQAPDAPARFRVLEQSALDAIDDARRRYPDDFLLHAVIMTRYGLRDEALEALKGLARTDPALAADLRESVRKWRP